MLPEKYVVYELKDASLADADALENLLPMTRKDIARVYGRKTSAYQADVDLFMECLGQKSAATRIKLVDGGAPRAYAHYPAVYRHPDDKMRAYMIAPLDFKGRHFMPVQAVMLNDKQSAAVIAALHPAGKPPAPTIAPVIKPHGIPVPMDFDPRSPLQIFDRYEAPFEADKVALLKKVMNNIRGYLATEKAVAGVSLAEDFTFQCYMTYEKDGRPGLIACAERKSDQARLAMNANCYFTPEPFSRYVGFHKIVPNTKYAGGMALQSFFDSMTSLSKDDVWHIGNEWDKAAGIAPPQTPQEYLRDTTAPWPFPKSSVAP